MPVPGPRTQHGPVAGYANPLGEESHRFNHWDEAGPVVELGRTPGVQMVSLRGNVLAAGFVRRLWRQSINVIGAQAPYSWTTSEPSPGRSGRRVHSVGIGAQGLDISRALRYLTNATVYMGSGSDNTKYAAYHTTVPLQTRSKPVTQGSGGRNRPTVRNRMTSFGSRVPTLNQSVPAAENTNNG